MHGSNTQKWHFTDHYPLVPSVSWHCMFDVMLGVSLSLTFPLNQAWVPDWKHNSEVSKQPCLIWVFCSFCCLPQTEERAFLFQREFCTLCSQCISEKLLIFIAELWSAGGCVKRGIWFLRKEKPLSFIHPKELLSLSSVSLKVLMFHLSNSVFSGHDCAVPGLAGLWLTEFAQLGCVTTQFPE